MRSDSEKGTLRPIYKVSNFTRMVDGDTYLILSLSETHATPTLYSEALQEGDKHLHARFGVDVIADELVKFWLAGEFSHKTLGLQIDR